MTKPVKNLRAYPCLNPRESASNIFSDYLRLKPRVFASRFHELLFALLVVLLPVQLGKHFWPEWTRVLGLRLDYLAPTLYLTDILVAGVIGSWIVSEIKNQKSKIKNKYEKFKKPNRECGTNKSIIRLLTQLWRDSPGVIKQKFISFINQSTIDNQQSRLAVIMLVVVFVYLNTSLSASPPVAVFKWLKLLELAFLTLYVANTYGVYPERSRRALRTLHLALPLAVIWSSLLAVCQYFAQSSLGGVFWFLGERTFDLATPGIAKIDLAGRLFLRPYSTFSHPNSMAGFLFVALVLTNDKLPSNLISSSSFPCRSFRYLASIFKLQSSNLNLQSSNFKLLLDHLTLALGTAAIALSFSRSVWVVALFVSLMLYFIYLKLNKFSRSTLFASSFFWVILLGLIGFFMSRTGFAEPAAERIYLNEIAINMIKDHPLTGIGLNNFLVRLPDYWSSTGPVYLLQPVHNIFILAAAELGLVGLFALLGLFGLTLRKLMETGNWKLVIPVLAILSLGLVDHYWFTLQQNQLLLAIVFGLAWKKNETHHSL